MSLQRAERACLLRNTAGTDRQDVSCRAENACVTVRRWPRPRERSSTRKRKKKKKNRRDTTIKRADPGGWSRAGTRDRLLPDCWHGGHDTGVSTRQKDRTGLSSTLYQKGVYFHEQFQLFRSVATVSVYILVCPSCVGQDSTIDATNHRSQRSIFSWLTSTLSQRFVIRTIPLLSTSFKRRIPLLNCDRYSLVSFFF